MSTTRPLSDDFHTREGTPGHSHALLHIGSLPPSPAAWVFPISRALLFRFTSSLRHEPVTHVPLKSPRYRVLQLQAAQRVPAVCRPPSLAREGAVCASVTHTHLDTTKAFLFGSGNNGHVNSSQHSARGQVSTTRPSSGLLGTVSAVIGPHRTVYIAGSPILAPVLLELAGSTPTALYHTPDTLPEATPTHIIDLHSPSRP